MRSRILVAAALSVAMVGAVALAGSEPGEPEADFHIVIEVTGSGVDLVCERGCVWETLSFDCGGRVPCSSAVDRFGMTEPAR